VEAETLCCLALALSGGQEKLETWSEDIHETRVGLCQVTCSTLSPPPYEVFYLVCMAAKDDSVGESCSECCVVHNNARHPYQ
jgi:hypothetical protein